MNIFLEGLIVHAEHHQSNEQVAYLIQDPDHHAYLTVPKTSINQALTSAVPGDPGADYWRFDLSRDVVTSLGSRQPEIYKLNYLPSLKNEMGGGKRKGVPKTHAVFFLPALGDFDFPSYFYCQLAYATDGNPPTPDDFQCVPRTVSVSVPTQTDVKFTNGDGKKIVIHPTADVWITNLCASGVTPCDALGNSHVIDNPHSAAYSKFYESNPRIAAPYSGSKCLDPRAKRHASRPPALVDIDVDCASSRYP
jgi:hypothetical protein